MHFHDRAIQGNGLQFDAHQLLLLEAAENPIQNSGFAPTVHARVDGVPVAKSLGQATPLATVLRHVQNGIEQLQVADFYIPTLPRQAIFNPSILIFRKFHSFLLT